MAKVLHGDASNNQLVVGANKTQAYGLKGSDTLISDGKQDVLLVGGSGNDSLVMFGGNGTLSGGKGSDTFELTYSADKPLTAVIEDLEPSSDKILVNHDGTSAPQLRTVSSGNDDVVWKDSAGNFNLTLKSVRDNDYFNGTAPDEAWKVLELTNVAREAQSLSALTLAKGLMAGATIRVGEITQLGERGEFKRYKHTRPDGTDYDTVLDGKYIAPGENLEAGAATPERVVAKWMASKKHRDNIWNKAYRKLGVGFNESDSDPSNHRFYWTQLFADSLTSSTAVSTAKLLKASIVTDTVSKAVPLTEDDDSLSNGSYGATIQALGGDDTIRNWLGGACTSINGGAGNDTITNTGALVTIEGGVGDDLISLSSNASNNLIQYRAGDGSDSVVGFGLDDTLSVDSAYTLSVVDNDFVLSVGDDSITLLNATSLSSININAMQYKIITLSDGNDTYTTALANATIRALGGNDSLTISGAGFVSINAGDDDDYIHNNKGSNATIDASNGNDNLWNGAHAVMIDGGAGSDSIVNTGQRVTIAGGDEDDYIRSTAWKVTIIGGEGSDTLLNGGKSVTIDAGAGNDSIHNSLGANVTIDAGDGDDFIFNTGVNVTILGGADDDTIQNTAASVTITGGEGDDSIRLGTGAANNLLVYEPGDGFDTVRGFKANSTLRIGDGTATYFAQTIKNNIIINVGAGSIRLAQAASLSAVNIEGTPGDLKGEDNIITLTEDAEAYSNTLGGVNILALGGDDSINNSRSNVTINAGLGDDLISLFGGARRNFIRYAGGDGNDSISGFNASDTLQIAGGAVDCSTLVSGSDILVTVGDDSITLSGAASLTTAHIVVDWSDWSVPDNLLTLSELNDAYSNALDGVTIEALGGNDTIDNEGSDVLIAGGDGNDSIENFSAQATILGGADKDTLRNYNTGEDVLIDGGDGNDSIENFSAQVTILGGADNDSIKNTGSLVTIQSGGGDDRIHNSGTGNVTIEGGVGNDSVYNSGDNVSINLGDGDDTVTIHGGKNVSIDGGAGNDFINNNGSHVTITGGTGNDSIRNSGANVSISGGSNGDKRIYNVGAFVTINSGVGNDSIYNSGSNVSINLGDGDDTVTIHGGKNVSIDAGLGNDRISLSSDAKNVLIRYTPGDGNDTIWGLRATSSLQIGDGTATYSTDTTPSGDDVIVHVGEGTVILKDFREKPEDVIIGASGTDGGGSGNGGNGDNGDNGNGGNGNGGNGNGNGGGNGGSNTTGGGSGHEGRGSDASSNQSASGSTGRGSSGNGGSSGNQSSNNRGDGRGNGGYVGKQWKASEATFSSPFDALKTTTPNANQYVYTGGNMVINTYQAGEKIFFLTDYTGSFSDGAGNFFFGSSTGALVVTNATDKFIDHYDAAGNPFVKAYTASSAGIIDGRGLAGFEVLNGSSGADAVFAGDGGSQLFGGTDNASDTLVGGNGSDIFIGGKAQGSDIFLNASSADVISLNDATTADIVATLAADDGAITVAFNNGNAIAVQSSEVQSATFKLADGSAYRFNHDTNVWQSVNQHVYAGGNQIINDYQAGEKILFNAAYTGSTFDNDGNFLVGSSTGALVVTNASDKIIDLSDATGNDFVKAYAATAAGVIDGRGLAGFEVINGSQGADAVFAGDGGSQLWGGSDNASDTLIGGAGSDIFIGGKAQGADIFLNASAADLVHLNDANLSDILAATEADGAITLAFNNGNAIAVQSSEAQSATFLLADGSAYRYNHASKAWQSA